MVWDYSQVAAGVEGVNHLNIHYSLHNLKDTASAVFKPGFLELVLHPTRKRRELWVARAETAGKVMRRKYDPADLEADLYNDDTNGGIDFQYRTPPIVFDADADNIVALKIRATGAGVMNLAAKSMDSTITTNLAPTTLTSGPGKIFLRWLPQGMVTHSLSYLITNGNIKNAYCAVSYLKTFYKRLAHGLSE
jgi:hypothetical protein